MAPFFLGDSSYKQENTRRINLIRGDCNRNFVMIPQYRRESARIKLLLASGAIDRWRDIVFESGEHNEGVYAEYPNKNLNNQGARVNLVKVFVSGKFAFEMRIPAILIKPPSVVISGQGESYRTCLDFENNDFVDYF